MNQGPAGFRTTRFRTAAIRPAPNPHSRKVRRWQGEDFSVLGLVFGSFGVASGSPRNLTPLFSQASGLISILLVIQIVPYFMTGLESIPKCAEEASLNSATEASPDNTSSK